MPFKTPSAAIANESQVLRRAMSALVQARGVFDQQILSRLAAGVARPLQVRCDHPFEAHSPLTKEPIGGFEFSPWREGLRESSAGAGSQMRGDVHQALITALITQLGKPKFVLSPLCRST